MPRKALLCEESEGCPGRVILVHNDQGQCELHVTHRDIEGERIFSCSTNCLQNAAMGAKTHIASKDGTCEIMPTSKRMVISVAPPGGTKAYYFVSREEFENALHYLCLGDETKNAYVA
jgi:hypothetical protein